MDRVKNFSEKVTKVINIFDTKEVELPFTDAEYRKNCFSNDHVCNYGKIKLPS